jgi:hypothetical protein
MKFPVPGNVLRRAREDADIRQSAFAKTLDTNTTFVSRLEKSGAVEPAFAERYLRAIDTELARQILDHYGREWVNFDPPSFLHPDREHLWQVEETLQRITAFEATPQNHPILAPTITSLRDDLSSVLRYLERLDHVIAWVGDIAVGKTTGLAYAAGLIIPDSKGQMRPVFPVGSGRVTLCETVIKTAPAFGVAVEPLSEDAIRTLVRDLIAGVAGETSYVPSEMRTVLRNMSTYRTRRVPVADDFETRDPIAEALAAGENHEILADKLIAAMNLPSRRETSLAISENADNGMQWLAQTIAKINMGQDPRFSVPRRVTVLVPSERLREAGDFSIVDTKGVEGITQRTDLQGYRDDPRTLVVLCTKFPDAPDSTAQRLLRENEAAGSDAAVRHRVAMLVLPRNDEPLKVLDQGELPSSRAEGYAIRREEINQALLGADLPKIRVSFYDAHLDPPEVIWNALRTQINLMRGVYIASLDRSARAVAELVANVDVVKTRGARREIQEEFDRLATFIGTLPGVRRHAHQNLLDQFDAGHQSSVAASMVRRGDWPNFPILHFLGEGVRQDANLRTADHFTRVEHKLEELEQKYAELADVRAMTGSLRDRMATWRQDFLTQALSIGSDAFRTVLANEGNLWAQACARYGTGVRGYKRDLAGMFQRFFEGTSAPDAARTAVETRLTDAWVSTIIEPLIALTRGERPMDEKDIAA